MLPSEHVTGEAVAAQAQLFFVAVVYHSADRTW